MKSISYVYFSGSHWNLPQGNGWTMGTVRDGQRTSTANFVTVAFALAEEMKKKTPQGDNACPYCRTAGGEATGQIMQKHHSGHGYELVVCPACKGSKKRETIHADEGKRSS